LTGLPNRVLLRDRFMQAAAIAHRESTGVALLFLDLDNFKTVNDSLGHSYGDQLLIRVVERLRTCIRASDTISRQGGDEFVILLNEMRDAAAVGVIAQSIIEVCAEPFPLEGYQLSTSFSIGISLFPQDGLQFDTLLKAADTALHQAKDSGRNNYRFFVEDMNVNAQEHVRLQGQLHSAVKNKEFALYYQAEVDMRTGHIVGAEALLRWRHPERGLVPPGTFIPLAERSGLIVPIGTWVLNEACRQAQAWRESGMPLRAIAVNLSAVQFKRGNLLETVVRALDESGLPARHLELELTESILLQDIDAAIRTLYSLRELGVRLSIDDFGTGYSSLSYLKRLAVNKLKIDQSFVRDLVEDPDDAAIVRAIIQLGQNLQLAVIAEGVETQAQWDYLSRCGCDEAQGYLIGRPMPADDFATLCASRTLARDDTDTH
jgi:diguanylate cyclase (GGDEF)-like protein